MRRLALRNHRASRETPRFRIAWVMVFIAVVAINFAAIRAMLGFPEVGLAVLGGLPMANILVVGNLMGRQRPGSRAFLIGFQASG